MTKIDSQVVELFWKKWFPDIPVTELSSNESLRGELEDALTAVSDYVTADFKRQIIAKDVRIASLLRSDLAAVNADLHAMLQREMNRSSHIQAELDKIMQRVRTAPIIKELIEIRDLLTDNTILSVSRNLLQKMIAPTIVAAIFALERQEFDSYDARSFIKKDLKGNRFASVAQEWYDLAERIHVLVTHHPAFNGANRIAGVFCDHLRAEARLLELSVASANEGVSDK